MKIFLLSLLLFMNCAVFSQYNFDTYKKYMQADDSLGALKYLNQWELKGQKDADYYASNMNYYFNYAAKEIVRIESQPINDESLEVETPSGGSHFLNSYLEYDPKYVTKATQFANEGMTKFPDRLDIQFGYGHILVKQNSFVELTKHLNKLIIYSSQNKNHWKWAADSLVKDGEMFFVSGIYDYMTQIYNTMNDDDLIFIQQIGEKTLEYYPDVVEILSMTGVAFHLNKNQEKALEYLQRAEKIQPNDPIVLNNIARVYESKMDFENAKKYYQLAIDNTVNDPEFIQILKESIEKLNK